MKRLLGVICFAVCASVAGLQTGCGKGDTVEKPANPAPPPKKEDVKLR